MKSNGPVEERTALRVFSEALVSDLSGPQRCSVVIWASTLISWYDQVLLIRRVCRL